MKNAVPVEGLTIMRRAIDEQHRSSAGKVAHRCDRPSMSTRLTLLGGSIKYVIACEKIMLVMFAI